MKSVSRILLLAFFVMGMSALFSCQSGNEPKERVFYEYFDTVSYIYDYGREDEDTFAERTAAVGEILEKYHKLSDIYHEYDGVNNAATVNRLAGTPVTVGEELFDLLTYAKEMCELTNGKTNVAMGSVLSLWHTFREDRENGGSMNVPTAAELSAAAAHTDIEDLILDAENLTVTLADPLMSLDLGAIAKGYATERAGEYLASCGAYSYVLNIGGNIKIIGTKPNGEGYVTGIRNPDTEVGGYKTTLTLSATSIVTSGDYERYVEVDGVRYHHVIDPETLLPAAYYASVSVITKDSALADALSTALFCMPEAEAMALADKLGVEIVMIDKDGKISATER